MSNIVCNPASLVNIGDACKPDFKQVRKILFTSIYDSDGALNKISITDAIDIEEWQALLNVYNFDENVLTKVTPTPKIFNFMAVQEDAEIFNEDGYRKKTKDGDYVIEGEFFDIKPYVIKKIKEFEGRDLAMYLILEDGSILVTKKTDDATHFYPLRIGNSFNLPNWNFNSGTEISREKFSVNLTNQTDVNDIVKLTVLDSDGDAVDMSDTENIYSLRDCTCTITSPLATGCTAVIATKKTDTTRTATPITGITAPMFVFRKVADDTEVVATSITESPNGTYTILASLTASTTYKLEVSCPGYDIVDSDVVIA